MSQLQRNNAFDLFKCIAAIGVVFVHFPFPGVFGKIMTSFGTCGVIFFFLISGYYAYNIDDEQACAVLMKRFKRNFRVMLTATAVFLIFTVLRNTRLGTIGEWASSFRNPIMYLRTIFMNDPDIITADPLWFMYALLYVYLILYVLHKFHVTKKAFYALPFLLLLRIWVENYTNTFNADWHLCGNFLVGALPIMLLGHFVAYKKEIFINSSYKKWLILTIVFALITFITVNVRVMGEDISQIFKILCGLSAFLFSLNVSQIKVPDFAINYILPLAALVLSTLLAMVIYRFQNKVS